MNRILIFALLLLIGFTSAQAGNGTEVNSGITKSYSAPLRVLTDAEYPDNNAIGFRSQLVGQYHHNAISLEQNEMGNFDITIFPGNDNSDTIFVKNINLLEMMPTVPAFVRGNKELTKICLLNQEWNRIQVRIPKEYYSLSGSGNEDAVISRVDIANNCLAKGLWECILFTKEGENEVLYFQSWFDFPSELYDALFEKRNGMSIEPYNSMLINYDHTLVGTKVELTGLRTISTAMETKFENKNDELYPLTGERKTKVKNIIYPTAIASINDFLTNDTRYATFAAPGYYTKTQPRVTELSRLQKLEKVEVSRITSTNAAMTVAMEFRLYFTSGDGKQTEFIIGGLQKDRIPVLNLNTHATGFQMPMGISNHSFYQSYADLLKYSSGEEPYYAFLLDQNGNWLDSHDVGIDGPLFWIDDQDPGKLHLMVLSFERHSFVGHYIIDLPAAL